MLPFLLLIALTTIWGFQWKDRSKKIMHQLEITSLNDTETSFEATVRLGGESIRLDDQKTPSATTIETSDFECLVDAQIQVRIIMTSKNGKLESDLKTAYLEASWIKKRIMGI